eukprot:scaffold117931_cov21-Tisochrysis_lutea.AAC.1
MEFRDCAGLGDCGLPLSVRSSQSMEFRGCAGLGDHGLSVSLHSSQSMEFRDCAGLGDHALYCAGLGDHRPYLPLRKNAMFPCPPCPYEGSKAGQALLNAMITHN